MAAQSYLLAAAQAAKKGLSNNRIIIMELAAAQAAKKSASLSLSLMRLLAAAQAAKKII